MSRSPSIPVLQSRRYPDGMSQPTGDVRTDMRAMLTAAGIEVTDEGVERARVQMVKVKARRTPEKLNAMRAKLGMPPLPA